MNWYLAALKKYAVFNGRARRKEYWVFGLCNLIVWGALTLTDMAIGTFNAVERVGLLSTIYMLAVAIPGLAVTVRRLHDTDRSAWGLLICLIPLVGAIVLFVFMALDSDPGQNRFGPNPKGVTP